MHIIPPTALRSTVIDICKTVYDPEIPVNIYDLGLIYDISVNAKGVANVVMTLTTPMCPVADILPGEVQYKIEQIQGITEVNLELTFDPPWSMSKMDEASRLEMNLF